MLHMTTGTCYASELTVSELGQSRRQTTQTCNKNQLPHIHILHPDDGLLIRLKHVDVRKLNKLKISGDRVG
jgi:hypothetical protein